VEYATDYATDRHAFGIPIIANQGNAFMLAHMATELEASRALVWKAAWLGKQRAFVNAEGSMAKLKAGRTATWITQRSRRTPACAARPSDAIALALRLDARSL
jgi:alkylation response protein AidB-like acyl-CoA dehydrogenase